MKKRLIAVLLLVLVIITAISGQIQVSANPIVITEGAKLLLSLMLVAMGMQFANEGDMETVVQNSWQKMTEERQQSLVNLTVGWELGKHIVFTPELKTGWNDFVNHLSSFYNFTKHDAMTVYPDMSPMVTVATTAPNASVAMYAPYLLSESDTSSTEPFVYYTGFMTVVRNKNPDGTYTYLFELPNGTEIEFNALYVTSKPKLGTTFMNYFNTASGKNCFMFGHAFRYSTSSFASGDSIWSPSTNYNSSNGKVYIHTNGLYDGQLTQTTGSQWNIGGIPVGTAGQYGLGSSADNFLWELIHNGGALTYGAEGVADLPIIEAEREVAIDIPQTLAQVATIPYTDVLTDVEVVPPEVVPSDTEGKIKRLTLPQLLFTKKFPFSLPYDLYNVFAQLVAPAEPPKFELILPFSKFGLHDEVMTIDFAQYEVLATISRWGLSVLFVIGLILLTRKIIGAQ